jgi:hypothetical protein
MNESSALNFGRSTSSARSSSGPIGLKLTLVASLVAWVVLAATGSNNTQTETISGLSNTKPTGVAPVEKPKSKPLRERGAHIPIDADADADAQDSAGVGEEITGKQIDAPVAIVRQHGYRCDSVTVMLPFIFSVGFTLDDRFHESCHKRGFIWIFGLLYRSRVPKMSGVEVSWQRGGGRLNCRLEMRIRRS